MTPEIDPEVGEDNIRIEPGDLEEYEVQPIALMDNGIIIFDPVEFCEVFSCYALRYDDGFTYVLDKESKKWRCIEDFGKQTTKPTLIK